MAKRQTSPYLRRPECDLLPMEDLRVLYETTYAAWHSAGGVWHRRTDPDLARRLMLMADISPMAPAARTMKGMYAVMMLEDVRLQVGAQDEVDKIAISALLDLIGRR